MHKVMAASLTQEQRNQQPKMAMVVRNVVRSSSVE
jgi:hypothetical protein